MHASLSLSLSLYLYPLVSFFLFDHIYAASNEFRFNWHNSGSLFPAGIPYVKILNCTDRERAYDSTFLPYRSSLPPTFFSFFFSSLPGFLFNFITANAARIVRVQLTPTVKYLHVRVAYR